ncbi:AraC family transcriptional regulator [Niallia sp. Man26]|uniref:AraC family transcriptional regulator n=1 Tax=Niallia sp. Man26 TaxID=2912824 RepID=UPI002060923D|nr:AraC family transcriptional regulator [Niallia sp. Man26]UPO86229.1 AraC family transcriptional regulator [Niallia sp. Man26]
MLVNNLREKLLSENEIEAFALASGTDDLHEILSSLNSASQSAEDAVLSADSLMNKTDKITIMKHPRYVDIKVHKHDFLEISYAYIGGFTQWINGETVVMKEGDLTILDTDVMHTIQKADKDTVIINILLRKTYFNHNILARLTENDLISKFVIDAIYKPKMKGRYLYFPSSGNEKIRNCVDAGLLEYYNPDIGGQEVLSCHIVLLFTELMRMSKQQPKTLAEDVSSIAIVDILQYIEEYYLTTSLKEVAKHFHFHPNYLSRLLKENIGKTFSEMVQELRLRQAKLLLENTQMQINRIADEAGYTNFNHFYKKFKEYYHTTPADYRKRVILEKNILE